MQFSPPTLWNSFLEDVAFLLWPEWQEGLAMRCVECRQATNAFNAGFKALVVANSVPGLSKAGLMLVQQPHRFLLDSTLDILNLLQQFPGGTTWFLLDLHSSLLKRWFNDSQANLRTGNSFTVYLSAGHGVLTSCVGVLSHCLAGKCAPQLCVQLTLPIIPIRGCPSSR